MFGTSVHTNGTRFLSFSSNGVGLRLCHLSKVTFVAPRTPLYIMIVTMLSTEALKRHDILAYKALNRLMLSVYKSLNRLSISHYNDVYYADLTTYSKSIKRLLLMLTTYN